MYRPQFTSLAFLLITVAGLCASPAGAKPKVCESFEVFASQQDSSRKVAVCYDSKRPRLVTAFSIITVEGVRYLVELSQ